MVGAGFSAEDGIEEARDVILRVRRIPILHRESPRLPCHTMRPSRRQMPPFTRRWTEGRVTATAILVGAQAFAYALQLCLEKYGLDRSYATDWTPW